MYIKIFTVIMVFALDLDDMEAKTKHVNELYIFTAGIVFVGTVCWYDTCIHIYMRVIFKCCVHVFRYYSPCFKKIQKKKKKKSHGLKTRTLSLSLSLSSFI
jgi:hypothetical protein